MSFSAPSDSRSDEEVRHLLAQYRDAEVGYLGFREMARANPRYNTPTYRRYRVRKALELRRLREVLRERGIPLPYVPPPSLPSQRAISRQTGAVSNHRAPSRTSR